jgi:hypothetical protein
MLDAIVRLSMIVFDESELIDLSPRKKLWYMLDPICALVDEKRNYYQAVGKAVYSDSEDSIDEEPKSDVEKEAD